jgi:CrcB protein
LCTSALLVAGGGAIGASARVGIELAVEQFGGSPIVWLLIVNLLGSFILGIAFARLDPRATDALDLELPIADLPGARRHHPIVGAFIATGLCGALTTYSSLSETLAELWTAGERLQPAMLVTLSLALGPAAIAVGIRIGRPRGRGPNVI